MSQSVRERANHYVSSLCTKLFETKYGSGTDIMREDWDNLIIMDACRYDIFTEEIDLNGKLEKRTSRGRNSHEFLDENFSGRTLHDTVYVTANPHVNYINDGVFHAIIDDPLKYEFDKQIGTVLPKHVTRAFCSACEKFPNKRIIAHYMQPHMPPIGKKRDHFDNIDRDFNMSGTGKSKNRFYNLVERGVIDPSDAIVAYRENLRELLNEIPDISDMKGKTVLTSDHGELLGECPCRFMSPTWSHGLTRSHLPKCRELCVVPWFVMESSTSRKVITEETPKSKDRLKQYKSKQQLKALGYI